MRSPRLVLAVTALCATAALSGCSGSDDEPSSAPPSSPPASEQAKQFQRPCDVQVETSGAVEASWQGKGEVTNAPGVTLYSAADGDNRIAVYAGNDDIPRNANVTVDGATFTTTDPDIGLDVAGNGTSAKVDADTNGIDGPGPHVSAAFTCGKSAKGKSGKR